MFSQSFDRTVNKTTKKNSKTQRHQISIVKDMCNDWTTGTTVICTKCAKWIQ